MTQEEMLAAITKAIQDGFASIRDSETPPSRDPGPPPDSETPTPTPTPTPSDNSGGGNNSGGGTFDGLKDALKSGTNTASGTVGMLLGAGIESSKAMLDALADQNAFIDTNLEYLRSIQKAYGGITDAQIRSGEALEGVAGQALGARKNLMLVAAGQKEAALEIESGALKGTNAMRMVFKDFAQAAKNYDQALGNLVEKNTMAAQSLNNLGQAEQERIAILMERMTIDSQTMSTMLQRQYAFTGEASSGIFEDIATVTTSLAASTGAAAEDLKRDIIDIMEDVETFGNIGVDSAGRIAGALKQLGVDFQTFSNMTSQFMNFETAASKMGELSAMFGIQMDAMEMTYLANEDQEEFLFKLREDLLDAGVDVENMSKTRQRFLADQVGVSVTQLQTFMREGEMMADQEDMFGATEAAKDMDGLATAIDNFGGEFKGATKDAQDLAKEMRTGVILPLEQDLMRLRGVGEKTMLAIQPKVPQESIDNFRKSISLEAKAIESQIGNIKLGVEFMNEGAEGLAGLLNKGISAGENLFGVGVEAQHEVTIIGDSMTTEQINLLSNELAVLGSSDIQTETQIQDLLKNSGLQQTQIDKVISELQSQKEVKVKIDLSAKNLGDKIFEIKESEAGGKFVVTGDK